MNNIAMLIEKYASENNCTEHEYKMFIFKQSINGKFVCRLEWPKCQKLKIYISVQSTKIT